MDDGDPQKKYAWGVVGKMFRSAPSGLENLNAPGSRSVSFGEEGSRSSIVQPRLIVPIES